MAFTQADVVALERAIALGATKVRFADNREVAYRSLAEMRSLLAEMTGSSLGQQRVRRTVAQFVSGT